MQPTFARNGNAWENFFFYFLIFAIIFILLSLFPSRQSMGFYYLYNVLDSLDNVIALTIKCLIIQLCMMADSDQHILPAVKKMCTSYFVQTVHVQNPRIVYKCVHALFVHLYMYKILRSYTNVYMHYLYICTCTKSSDRIQMCTCIICTFIKVQKGKSWKKPIPMDKHEVGI